MSSVKKNFAYNSLYQIFSIIVPLITTPYLSRILGAEGVGIYAYVYSIAYYFTLFIKLGLNNYGNRTIAAIRDDMVSRSKAFWNMYTLQALLGIFLTIAYIAYGVFLKEKDPVWIILSFFVASGFLDITWFYYGLEEFKTVTIRDMSIKILTVICIFIFVKDVSDVWKYALIRSLGFLLSQLLLWPLMINRILWVRPTLGEMKRHIMPNLILFVPTIAVSLYKTMDKIMLGKLSEEIEVGYYESCEKVIQVPMALIVALGNVMLPHMSSLYSKKGTDREIGIALLRKSEHMVILVVSVITLGVMAVASEFVPLFYGSGFEKCVDLFYVLLPSCIFIGFANVIRTQYLIPNKMDKEFIISVLVGAILNLSANVILIPRNQSLGAAIGTLMAEISVCIVQIYYIRKKIPILKIAVECIPYLVISILMFSIGLIMPISTEILEIKFIIKIILCGIFWISSIAIYWIGKYFFVLNKKKADFNLKELLEKCL